MAEQALVIEDFFSEGTSATVEHEEASPTNKKSDSGVVEAAGGMKPGDEAQRQLSGTDDEEEKKNESHGEQEDNKHQQAQEVMIGDNRPQGPPAAKEATDFLPFHRSVVETDTLLE